MHDVLDDDGCAAAPTLDPEQSTALRAADNESTWTPLPVPKRPGDGAHRAHALAEVRRRLVGEKTDAAQRIGRFQLLRKIGEGGMGVVYSAYDEELDRRVAIKLIRDDGEEAHRARMRREAQAMARLAHPNVVPVYDVGTHEGHLFIAMEFVAGETLRQWRQATRRSVPEIVATFVQAARGLAAAHAAGLVHRDFKPDNAAIGTDGRVRVLDFGLARRETGPTATTETVDATALPGPRRGELDTPLTEHGAVMGTPAYMAPEQFLGERVDARTDQFSFCVALYEALYGERPFAGKDRMSLAARVTRGDVADPPRGNAVPAWIRAVLLEGLAPDPAERHASMAALCDALERGRKRRRVRRLGAGLFGVGLAGIAVAAGIEIDERRRITACEEDGAAIAEVWNERARAELDAGLLGSGAGHAAGTVERVVPWLEDHAQRWATVRTEACSAATVEHAWTDDLFQRAAWCLDERRLELDALVRALGRGGAEAVTRAVPSAAGLRRPESCVDPAVLERLPSPPTDAREELQTVREELSRATVLHATGALADGLEVARRGQARAHAVGWPPLVAKAGVTVGRLLKATGDFPAAEAELESAYFVAAQAEASEEAYAAASELGEVVGQRLARPDDGERWLKLADLAGDPLPDPGHVREATSLSRAAFLQRMRGAYGDAAGLLERALSLREEALGPEHPDVALALHALASTRYDLGAYDEAEALMERALRIRETALGPSHPDVAKCHGVLANIQYAKGSYERAVEMHERALQTFEAALGKDHPDVGAALNNLALARRAMGDNAEAARLHERVVRLRERALGPNHPLLAGSLSNLAVAYQGMGEHEQAAELHERALKIRESALGPDHPDLASSLTNLGNVRYEQGAFDASADLHARALAIREKALGPDHPDVAKTLVTYAAARRSLKQYDDARELYQRALTIREKALGPDHPEVAHALLGLAEVELERGLATEALPLAERALSLREATRASPVDLAFARYLLARVLVAMDGDGDRATRLAQQARDEFRSTPGAPPGALAGVEALLRAPPR